MSNEEETGACHGLKDLNVNNNYPSGVNKSKKSLLDYFHLGAPEHTKMLSKSTQVNGTWITEEDISSDVPSEKFYHTLAEKRRMALEVALGENEELHKLYESLTIENNKYQNLLEEANSFVDVFKELVQSADDTGIDVTDLNKSTKA